MAIVTDPIQAQMTLDSFVRVLQYLLSPEEAEAGVAELDPSMMGDPGYDPTMGQPQLQGMQDMPIDPSLMGQQGMSPAGGIDPSIGQQPPRDVLAEMLGGAQGMQQQSTGLTPPVSQQVPPVSQPPQRRGVMSQTQQSAPTQMRDNLYGTLQALGIQV